MRIHGRVLRAQVGGSSKSARDAVVLEADSGRYVLRVASGNAFADPRLDALVGKSIEAEGDLHQGVLIMTRWHQLPD
jgi:hypothetical protein